MDHQGCRCGHPEDVHRHWRDGTDCAYSGRLCGCRAYRPAFTPWKRWWIRLRFWFSIRRL